MRLATEPEARRNAIDIEIERRLDEGYHCVRQMQYSAVLVKPLIAWPVFADLPMLRQVMIVSVDSYGLVYRTRGLSTPTVVLAIIAFISPIALSIVEFVKG